MYNIEQIWKDWRIVKLLGEGSFGKVYEIERNNYGIEEHSALKVITIPQSTAEVRSLKNEGMDEQSVTSFYLGLVKDFAQEIALMSKLKGNPGIVAYDDYAIVEHENDFGWDIVIRMELLTPLADHMRAREYGEEEIINLAIELCDALSLCHKKSIIHRDIKIDNIFVSDSGRYKLGDFGVARTIEKTSGGLSKKGTYSYMAPEVYKGEAYGHKADIYSLGMVLYKLLNYNREPFLPLPPETIKYTDKNNALVRRMKGEQFEPPANADFSLAKIIMKACAYLPEDRFVDSTEMKSELDRVRMKRIQAKSSPSELEYSSSDGRIDETVSAFSNNSSVHSIDATEHNHTKSVREASGETDMDDERTMSAFSDSSHINNPNSSSDQYDTQKALSHTQSDRIPDNNEWKCPRCGKIHYKYVGTCGCGEPKPANVGAFIPQQTVKKESAKSENTRFETIAEQNDTDSQVIDRQPTENEWKCPKCGKIQYKYVGTCGCGEPKPANVGAYIPPQPVKKASAESDTPHRDTETEQKATDSQESNRQPTENEWKCPKCGKIHYKYVGTCGCGEPKPANVGAYIPPQPVKKVSAESDTYRLDTKTEKQAADLHYIDRQPNENEWKCPKCGKIHYNYVGTCGCGEPKPDILVSPSLSSRAESDCLTSSNPSAQQEPFEGIEEDDRTVSAFD